MPAPVEKAVAEFIAWRIRQMFPTSSARKKKPGEYSLQQIADLIGVKKPVIDSALRNATGIGPKFEIAFAAKYYNGSRDQLRNEALAWWAVQPGNAIPIDQSPPSITTRIPFTSAEVTSNPWVRRDDATGRARAMRIPQESVVAVNERDADQSEWFNRTSEEWIAQYFAETRRMDAERLRAAYAEAGKLKSEHPELDLLSDRKQPKRKSRTQRGDAERKPKSTRRTGT